MFILQAFELGMVSCISLDGRNDIVSVKSTWIILYSELKACMLPPLGRNNKRCETNKKMTLLLRFDGYSDLSKHSVIDIVINVLKKI